MTIPWAVQMEPRHHIIDIKSALLHKGSGSLEEPPFHWAIGAKEHYLTHLKHQQWPLQKYALYRISLEHDLSARWTAWEDAVIAYLQMNCNGRLAGSAKTDTHGRTCYLIQIPSDWVLNTSFCKIIEW